MSGFVFRPPNADATPPADPPSADVVQCDGWWPDINITELRDAVRLDTNIPPARLRDAVRQAMLDIAAELNDWRLEREAAGADNLTDVPARIMVDGQSDYVLRWARTIYSCVGADLGERLIGQGATAAGVDRAEALANEVDPHLRNVRHAVRDFLGRPRIVASLV